MEDKKEILRSYMKANVAPILVDFLKGEYFQNGVIIPANINKAELNGYYDNDKYLPPKWFNEVLLKKLLIIDSLDSIQKEEQLKFCELLKYRKISTFELPDDCIIIITADDINKNKIHEDIFSLVAKI